MPDALFPTLQRGPKWLLYLIGERTVIFVITMNAIVIFLDAFPPIRAVAHDVLFAIDYVCIVYFLIEVLGKLYSLGPRTYFASGWNIFDFSVVVLSSPTLLIPFGLESAGLSALLVLRLIRLSRFLRLLRFIPRLERLIAGARRALRASVGVLLAMLFYVFLFGLAGTYLFGGESSPVREQFADPLISMFTMFTVFTIEGWYETPNMLAAESDYWAAHAIRIYFVIAVVTGGIILLSLLNAVFVEEMSSDLREQAEEEGEETQLAISKLGHDLAARLDRINERLDRLER